MSNRGLMNYPIAVFMIAVAVVRANGETNDIHVLDLDHAVAFAERRHPELAHSAALVEAAKARAQQAGAYPNPEAIARAEAVSGSGNDAEYLAGISQTVPLSRKLSKARQAEELEAQRLLHEREARRLELRRRVHSSFATALYQEHAFRAQKAMGDDAARLVDIVKARIDAGDATAQDLARTELDNERSKIEVERAAAAHKQALVALAATIGDPQLTIRSLTGDLDSVWDLPAIEELARELKNHPVLLADAKAIASRRVRLDASKSQRIPDVRVDLLYRRLQNDKQNTFDVGFAVPLPLFDRNQGRIREARSELSAAEANARITENELTLRLRAAYATLSAALNTGAAFKSNILPRAEALLKTAQERYTLGDITLSELLAVRREASAMKLSGLELSRDIMEAWAEVQSLVAKL